MDTSISIRDDFASECLEWHNYYRRKHDVPSLKYSKSLCAYAQEWANVISKDDSMRHRPDNIYGENLFVKWSTDSAHKIKATEAVNSWYSEIDYFRFGIDDFSTRTGHFTQVVWKSSKKFGAGLARSGSGKIYVVGNYHPAGNVQGEFTANVLPPIDFLES